MHVPTTVDELLRLASTLRREGRVVEAIDAYERVLQRRPNLPDSWYNLALMQRQAGRFASALDSYAQALHHGVRGAEEVHLNRAVILSDDLARPDDAERELRTGLALNPRYVPAWLNLGNLCEDRGQRSQAQAAYEQVLQIEPGHALALARLPNLRTLTEPGDRLIARLRQALAARPLRAGAIAVAAERADLCFGLGKALDDVGAYDEAFAAYEAANQASQLVATAHGVRYDAQAHERTVDALIAAFPTAALPTAGLAAAAPDGCGASTRADAAAPSLFICGMFRSGSTLVEQILAAHSQVTAGGELDLLPSLVRHHLPHLGTPGWNSSAIDTAKLRTLYSNGIAALFPGAGLVTDKRPDNFLYIGLIKTLFPAARIVHTRRDALDNCLSVFFLHLGHAMPYALNLLDTAHWYGQYQRLMAHWQALYGDDIVDVDYDALVAGPRPVIDKLLGFCGLPWDEACMAFHQAPGVVKTASVWQVRQPLYQRSSGRWRHYQRHLGPLRDALAAQLSVAAPAAPALATSAPAESPRPAE